MKRATRFLTVFAIMVSPAAMATCYKVTSVGRPNTTANWQIRPGEGVASSWLGACGTCNGSLGLPSVINVSDPSFQPYPTLLASAVVPFTQYGSVAGYDPEHVLFRCEAQDEVYEMFSTNGNNLYSGWYRGGDSVGNAIGLQHAYSTAWPNVLLRLTHLDTGQYITSVWNERRLSGLDRDSRGYQLLKAKNLSAVRAELFSAPFDRRFSYYRPTDASRPYTYAQPAAYIAIKGPGIGSPRAGGPHFGNYRGWFRNWPGALGLYNRVTLKRYPTCAVTSVTSHVTFAPISEDELNAGASREVPFEVAFKCQQNAESSTALNATALGLKVSPGSLAASSALGLMNAEGGSSYLLSDRYGQPGIAEGVGIRILRSGAPINLLANEDSAGGVASNSRGWYPVVGAGSNLAGSLDGVAQYSEIFHARLEKLQGPRQPAVTGGRVEATAQVVIRVQ
ncbi:fimbrial protein [Pseudomonas cremoricolorata]|uniref:fimbrial protein n=1 Tax=Pseudomonas cremoricolorata TaxID=157783 RepID=UPI00067691BD|nr:fimbrial protein [Pseudomonas cremoricolorata]